PLYRVGERELADREPEEIDAEGGADARNALGLSAEYFRCRGPRPRDAGISEQRDLDRERSIHPRGCAEGPQQREPELEVRDQDAATHQAIERRAHVEDDAALVRVQRVHIVAADERGITDIERVQATVLAATAVTPVMKDARRECVERRRHEISA